MQPKIDTTPESDQAPARTPREKLDSHRVKVKAARALATEIRERRISAPGDGIREDVRGLASAVRLLAEVLEEQLLEFDGGPPLVMGRAGQITRGPALEADRAAAVRWCPACEGSGVADARETLKPNDDAMLWRLLEIIGEGNTCQHPNAHEVGNLTEYCADCGALGRHNYGKTGNDIIKHWHPTTIGARLAAQTSVRMVDFAGVREILRRRGASFVEVERDDGPTMSAAEKRRGL